MSLQHILLGMLEQPASGYDLKQAFEQQQAHYWSANLAQIYPTLNRMEEKGLLASTEQPSPRGPPRRVYARTRAGRKVLIDWLTGGPEVHTDRLGWLAQVGFLSNLDRSGQVRFLLALRDEFQRHRGELLGIESHWKAADPGFPDALEEPDLFAHFTLRLGVKKYATIIDWCDECLERLDHRSPAALARGAATRSEGSAK